MRSAGGAVQSDGGAVQLWFASRIVERSDVHTAE